MVDFKSCVSNSSNSILYLIVLGVNFTMFAKIIITLKRRALYDNGTGRIPHKAKREQYKVARLLITNGVVYFVCFTPWQLVHRDDIVSNLVGSPIFSNRQYTLLLNLSSAMSYVNSSINPFVYMIRNSTYRNAYMKTFCLKGNK